MARTKVKLDERKKLVTVENGNVLEDERRQYKPLLDISVYSCYVEVPYEVEVGKVMKLELAATAAVKAFEKELRDGLSDLASKIQKLQADEKKGNKKAVSEASKLVKSHDKKLKDSTADYNIAIRKAVQKAVADETKKKMQLRSTGRSYFKGLSLADGVFMEEDDSVDLGELGDDLESAGKKFVSCAEDDKKARKAAAEAGEKLCQQIEAVQKKTPRFDYAQFQKDEKNLIGTTDKTIGDYEDLLGDGQKEARRASKAVKKIEQDKTLKSDREAMRAVKEYHEYFNKVDKTFTEELRDLGVLRKALGDLKNDAVFKQVKSGVAQLAKPLALDKLLKEMEKSLNQLEKLAKKR